MSQPKPRGGTPLVPMIISLILVLIGVATLQAGMNEFNRGNFEFGLIYISVTVFTFGMVAMNILRPRRRYAGGAVMPSKVMSVVRCAQCSFKQIRNFAGGEYVFKAAGTCTQCGSPSLFINGIYAEDLKRR